MRDDRERLQDILDTIKQIEKYAEPGKDRFMKDELIQTWVVHHLIIIGEASSRVSQETKEKYPDLPWVGTIDVRNIITHEYFRIALNIIWMIVKDNLPDLKEKIENIL
ncbi:HepT-like ribonuclease domain-containing protein [Crocosphaera sp. Alani8]|uniref:HepT-like ribonuclease domain-containing protein n=1 Tax=Crocosphaera sp. Alani8 TaxID=3038952 RepID=UPI00313C5120